MTAWSLDLPGVVELPGGRRVRGRGLREGARANYRARAAEAPWQRRFVRTLDVQG
ncbi:hypothetical protein [Microbacterium atlanticum]|uniref:hypothetical protein n=1 Tax=Microbacterium atlanticum TaxID=2782168 RepID=UPI0018878C1A|nr:hypothetical protein [Microbacterium atlanticum]